MTSPCQGFDSHTSLSLKQGNSNGKSPALSEISERDKPWDQHRAASDVIAGHYAGSEFNRYKERIDDCSQFLDFVLAAGKEEGSYRLKLFSARFCRVRSCETCAWRRSLMYKARAYRALPHVVEDHPSARYLFLTLTVKNCVIYELRDTLKHLNESFNRMTKMKLWPGIGYLKTVEVTRGRDGSSAHPHLHILVMVPGSYYGRKYLSQKRWCDLWQKALRVDYKPILDVQALKIGESPVGLLAEIIKYQCKPSQLIYCDRSWFLELTRQLHRTKAIAFGGIFKEYFRDFDRNATDEELIAGDSQDTDLGINEGYLRFNWVRIEKLYRLMDY